QEKKKKKKKKEKKKKKKNPIEFVAVFKALLGKKQVYINSLLAKLDLFTIYKILESIKKA
ncbi:hypothetical protein K491DRAFT_723760, partial [Lophiostoma macrostomum CBS 122681]